jgi:hypothetical protein
MISDTVEAPMIKKPALVFIFVAIAPIFSVSAPAQVTRSDQTNYGHIVALQTGSLELLQPHPIPADDTMIVVLDVAFVNSSYPPPLDVLHPPPPVPCKVTKGTYALDPKDTGVKVNESVMLSAYLAGRKVSLVLNGCVFDMPRIVSVNMLTTQ